MNLREVEEAFGHFKACPKCNSAVGFWLGSKDNHAYAQCKNCGTEFGLFAVYLASEKSSHVPRVGWFKK